MHSANVSRAILGGLAATIVMTMMMYAAPMVGMPKMDIAAMLGSMMGGGQMPEPYSGPWWMGMLLHFINGTIIFPLFYAYLIYPMLEHVARGAAEIKAEFYIVGSPWLRGLGWGLILWHLSQVVMRMKGMGLFSANELQQRMSVTTSLMGHIIYGAILGAIAGVQAVRVHR